MAEKRCEPVEPVMDLITSYCAVDTPHLPYCYSVVKDFAPAVFALVLGVVASVLTVKQYNISRTQMHLDLFEKRLKIHNSLLLNLANDMGDASLDQNQRSAALVDIEAAGFLFPKEVVLLIKDLQATAAAHKNAERSWKAMRDTPLEDETKASATQQIDLRRRYDWQRSQLSEKVARLMPFGQLKA